MDNILTIAYVTIAVILLFGAAIFVHEWGHYWVALKRGLKVEEFAIGFGPKLFAWKRGEVLWTIRAFPAGGFVKLPQMITSEALEGSSGGEALAPISPLSKILVAFAGPFMNVVFAFAIAGLLYFVGLPVLVNPSFIGHVEADSAEGKLGIREGDQIVAIDSKPVDSWQQINMEVIFATTNVFAVSIARDGVTNIHQLTARTREGSGGLKWLDLPPREAPVVGSVEPGKPAEAAGLKEGDRFVSFGGVPVYSQERLIELVNKSDGKESEVVVLRDDQELAFKVTPFYDAENKRGRIGIGFSAGTYRLQKPGPSPVKQVLDVLDQMKRTLSALFNSKKSGVGAKDLSGPVGILQGLAYQVIIDYRLALSFMVLLNINLAILNLLPVPVLDGGHITMAIYEAIFRRPVSLRFQEYATGFFAILLIGFMLYVTVFGDIARFGRMTSMFRHASQSEVVDGTNAAPARP